MEEEILDKCVTTQMDYNDPTLTLFSNSGKMPLKYHHEWHFEAIWRILRIEKVMAFAFDYLGATGEVIASHDQ